MTCMNSLVYVVVSCMTRMNLPLYNHVYSSEPLGDIGAS